MHEQYCTVVLQVLHTGCVSDVSNSRGRHVHTHVRGSLSDTQDYGASQRATVPASAQVPQEMLWPSASLARLTASGLAAMAVMNMALLMVLVWKHVFIR